MKNCSFHQKQEYDLYVNWATTILRLAAIMAGLGLQNAFLRFCPLPFVLPFYLKILTIFVILSGLFVAFIV